jgi:hypothetical protein
MINSTQNTSLKSRLLHGISVWAGVINRQGIYPVGDFRSAQTIESGIESLRCLI